MHTNEAVCRIRNTTTRRCESWFTGNLQSSVNLANCEPWLGHGTLPDEALEGSQAGTPRSIEMHVRQEYAVACRGLAWAFGGGQAGI